MASISDNLDYGEYRDALALTVRPAIQDLRRTLRIKLLANIPAPVRATEGSIGYDVFASVDTTVPAGCRRLVALGFSMIPPIGTYGRLAPRSGLSVKKGIHVMAGVIDPDYRGEVHVLLLNTGDKTYHIDKGERVAQLILEQAVVVQVVELENLNETNRGTDGFGSTG